MIRTCKRTFRDRDIGLPTDTRIPRPLFSDHLQDFDQADLGRNTPPKDGYPPTGQVVVPMRREHSQGEQRRLGLERVVAHVANRLGEDEGFSETASATRNGYARCASRAPLRSGRSLRKEALMSAWDVFSPVAHGDG